MFDNLIKFFQKNKIISLILIFILIKLFLNKKRTIENMTQLASTCNSNIYQLNTKNQILIIREINNSEKHFKLNLIEKEDWESLKNSDVYQGSENQLILFTPGDNNYSIKYNNDNLFLSFDTTTSLVNLDKSSKRFKFINAKDAGIIDAEEGDYLITTEYNKYVVFKDSMNLGFDKNDLIINQNLINGKTIDQIKNMETSDFIGIPVFKLTCIN